MPLWLKVRTIQECFGGLKLLFRDFWDITWGKQSSGFRVKTLRLQEVTKFENNNKEVNEVSDYIGNASQSELNERKSGAATMAHVFIFE